MNEQSPSSCGVIQNIPNVVIVGRPNVGKSTLFNTILKRMAAIVDSIPGTTRDRISAQVSFDNLTIELVDTGGIDPDLLSGKKTRMGLDSSMTPELLWSDIQKQINIGLQNAALILFVVDIRDGITPVDEEINQMLHRQNKPVILCVNKADNQNLEDGQNEFYRFGWEMIAISALQKRGLDALREKIKEKLPKNVEFQNPQFLPDSQADAIRNRDMAIAIVGKRNVGKSSLVNALARQERTIVSELPGTTRDAIDVRFERDGQSYVAIDTAGVKKKSKLKEAVDLFSQQRAESSIKRADVVILMIDAKEDVSEVDKKIANTIIEYSKPCIVAINKWDLVKDLTNTADYQEYINKSLPFFTYAPMEFISALTGFNITQMIKTCRRLYQQAGTTIQTAVLNRVTEKIKTKIPVVHRGAHQPKIYYATQTGTYPPVITLMINNRSLFSKRALRYIEQQLHKELPIREVPIKILIKSKGSREPR